MGHKIQQIGDLMNFREALDFTGKVALITGAGGGIGRSTAAAFAQCGAKVMLMDLERAEEKLKANVEEIRKCFGAEADYVTGDVSDEESVKDFVKKTVDRFGKIDILHNNAGISMGAITTIDTMTKAQWDKEVSINLTGIFLVAREVATLMRAQGNGGAIINTASMSGHIINTEPCYSATKAAVIHLTSSLALEYIKAGIRINSVSYGGLLSGLHETYMKDPVQLEARYDFLDKNTPMGRLGTLSEAAGPVLFLASDLASYMTGADIIADGGYVPDGRPKNLAD